VTIEGGGPTEAGPARGPWTFEHFPATSRPAGRRKQSDMARIGILSLVTFWLYPDRNSNRSWPAEPNPNLRRCS
jgi:hypothetical protein